MSAESIRASRSLAVDIYEMTEDRKRVEGITDLEVRDALYECYIGVLDRIGPSVGPEYISKWNSDLDFKGINTR